MGLFSKLFKRRKKIDETIYLKTDEEMRREKEKKQAPKQNINTDDKNINNDNDKLEQICKKEIKPKEKTTQKVDDKQTSSQIVLDDEDDADEIANDAETTTVNLKGVSGLFEIKRSKDGRFVFNLYASNHVIIATSQVYSSSTNAVNGINSVITNAEKAGIEDQTLKTYNILGFPKWEIYKDKAEHFRFRLRATNGNCICHSQGYTSKANCKNGIESIIKNSKNAQIDKSYLKK